MFWIIVFLILAALVTWYGYLKPYRHWKNMGVPQLHPWFLFGDTWHTLLRRKTLLEWLEWIYRAHPDSKYTGVYQMYSRTLVIKDPDLIKLIAIKDFEYFTDHQSLAVTEDVDPLWGKNLFALKGQRWREMRAVLSGTFTSSKMRIIYGLIADEAGKFARHFQDKDDGKVQEVQMKDVLSRYATNVIASASFGIQVNSLEEVDNEFYRMGKEVTNFNSLSAILKFFCMIVCPWLLKFFKIPFLSKRATDFFSMVIDENVSVREENKIVRPDMINLLLEVKKGQQKIEELNEANEGFAVVDDTDDWEKSSKNNKPSHQTHQITNQDITAQALIFFLAGYETVSSVMSYTCYELAINPDVQDKLRLEIQDVYQGTKGKPSYEVLLGMKYLDMVVTEGLRKWPVAVVADRLCVKPYTFALSNPQDPTISMKVMDMVWIPIYSIHHDPKYYPEPEKFIPERFSEENKVNIKQYTYLPFGVGPRACIGSRFALLEIKSMLFHLLNEFEIVPVKETRIPLKFSKSAITLEPEGGIPLGFKRLSDK